MYPDTLAAPQVVVFLGKTYRRMGGKSRYYLSQSRTNAGRQQAKGLHVAIWEHVHKRKVPSGYEVHHKDRNWFNNDPANLVLISLWKHRQLHAANPSQSLLAHLESIRPLASNWHRSEEGRAWHRETAKIPKRDQSFICKQCGNHFTAHRPADFCSPYCGYKFRAATGQYEVSAICVVCGSPFTARKPINPSRVRKTCSPQCAGKRARLQSQS